MTPSSRPVTRESSAYARDRGLRPIIVTIVGSVLLLRPKGLRSEEALDIGAAWDMAVKQRLARASAVMPGAAALISAAIEARAAIEQAQAAAAAGGCWTDSFDRLGRPCRMFVPSEA
jgi:hypothetical protein